MRRVQEAVLAHDVQVAPTRIAFAGALAVELQGVDEVIAAAEARLQESTAGGLAPTLLHARLRLQVGASTSLPLLSSLLEQEYRRIWLDTSATSLTGVLFLAVTFMLLQG